MLIKLYKKIPLLLTIDLVHVTILFLTLSTKKLSPPPLSAISTSNTRRLCVLEIKGALASSDHRLHLAPYSLDPCP